MINSEQIKNKLLTIFPDAQVNLKDLTGGQDHWQLSISSSQFNGLGLVQQHQLVYQALGDWMKKEIHALALTTSGIQ